MAAKPDKPGTTLPAHILAEAKRVMDAEARRILDEQLEAEIKGRDGEGRALMAGALLTRR